MKYLTTNRRRQFVFVAFTAFVFLFAAQTATAQETPLPQFTNIDEAIAEGINLLDLNKTEKAIEAFRQAVKLNPDSGEAYFRLGIAYAQIERAEKEKILTSTEATPTPTPAKKAKKGKKLLLSLW